MAIKKDKKDYSSSGTIKIYFGVDGYKLDTDLKNPNISEIVGLIERVKFNLLSNQTPEN